MKFLKRFALFFFSFLVIISIAAFLYLKSTAPTYEGIVEVENIQEEIELRYDNYGIPHIYAQNSEDAYFALGYAHAQDRLFQMEIIRRLVSGKMAEVLGPDLIDTDKHLLTLGIRAAAEVSAKTYMSDTKQPYYKASMAYLKGVNYFQDTGPTPLEFTMLGIKKKEFTAVDMYTTLGYMSLGFSAAIVEEPYIDYIKTKLGIEYVLDWDINNGYLSDSIGFSATNNIVKDTLYDNVLSFISIEKLLSDLAIPIWTGSNGWVISADRSESGKVVLANDTHIAHGQPSVWYEAHINYPGYEFYGNFLAGVPFGVLGHNRKLGWGMTIFPLDNLDLYREKRNPNNNKEVWENGQWVEMKVRKEIIKVKGQSDIDFDVYYSRHGAIINEINPVLKEDEEPIALSWEATKEPSRAIEALYEFNNAQNIEEFKAALPLVDIIGLNVLYGDVEDNIAWWATGKMPKHNPGIHTKVILDGTNIDNDVIGYYDFKDNPHSVNPVSGVIASANNEPFSDVADGVMYPGYYCPSNRFERVSEMLSIKEKWNLEDFKAIQLDVKSKFHQENLLIMYHSLVRNKEAPVSDFSKEVLDIMKNWDGKYTYTSKGPLVYQKMIYHVMDMMVSDEMPKDSYEKFIGSYVFKKSIPKLLSNGSSVWWDNISTSEVNESRSDIILKAFNICLAELKQQCGQDVTLWKWVDHHKMTHVHPIGRKKPFDKVFNVGPFDVEGGNGVPNKLEFKNNKDGKYDVISGAAIRILIDFNDVEGSENIIPTGQSGNVMSPHYGDQGEMYAKGEYRKQLMNKEEIMKVSTLLKLVKK